jgi:hypothetical protein
MQAALAEAVLSRLQPRQPDSIRAGVMGSFAELVQELGAALSPWAERFAAVALRELSCAASQNRHHGVFVLGLMVRTLTLLGHAPPENHRISCPRS